MKFKFEDLEVWQLSMDLTNNIYKLSKKYPDIERFNLTSQLISSVTSISLNIAEGSGKSTK
jgi:four helix bundle protein